MKRRIGTNNGLHRLIAAVQLTALLAAACMAGPAGCGVQGANDAKKSAAATPQAPQTACPEASPTPEATAAPEIAAAGDGGMEAQAAVPIYRVEPIDPEVVNVLLIGTDSRSASGTLVGGNADTLILASCDRAQNTVTLVSFMRDAYLPIGGPDGEYNKLKAAYRWGGTGMLINTLNSCFSLDIQSYVAVGLEGFAVFVDEVLGGLDVELNAAEIVEINTRITAYENESAMVKNCPPVTAPPGLVHLNGAQTLLFARNRSTSADGQAGDANDYDRAARQQEVLRLMYEKFVACEPVSAVPGVVRFALGHVETNLGLNEICRLAEPLMAERVEIHSAEVPFPDTWSYGGDGSGILFDQEATAEALHALLYE